MLWIYAKNDTLFNPEVAQSLHAAFTLAGGNAKLILSPPFRKEGHQQFVGRGGSKVWGPAVERYLKQRMK